MIRKVATQEETEELLWTAVALLETLECGGVYDEPDELMDALRRLPVGRGSE
jgi:hypothetical protein